MHGRSEGLTISLTCRTTIFAFRNRNVLEISDVVAYIDFGNV